MATAIPPLRALQAFDAFGRLGSVNAAASALGVTPGAISQQLHLLEDHVGVPLMLRDGRREVLTPAGRSYHDLVAQGFGRLIVAQDYIHAHRRAEHLTISGFPTLLHKFVNPRLGSFATGTEHTIRIIATHQEPDPQTMEQMFRLTYGEASKRFAHARVLYTDHCFPVCSPRFLARHPEARDPAALIRLPLIAIDWGQGYTSEPDWRDWFLAQGLTDPAGVRPGLVHSMSSLALDAAADDQGAVLAQGSFVQDDLQSGRLVRLSPVSLPMPDPYHVCWGPSTLDQGIARSFLNWLMRLTKPLRAETVETD